MSSRSSTTTRRMTSSPWTSGAEGPLGLCCLSVGHRRLRPFSPDRTVRLPYFLSPFSPRPPSATGLSLVPMSPLLDQSGAFRCRTRPWGPFRSGHSPNGRRDVAVQHYTPLGAANAVRMVCTLPSFPLSDPFRCKIAEDHPPRLCLGGASPNLRPSQSLSRAILTLSPPIHCIASAT
jgi:hypothetical protein